MQTARPTITSGSPDDDWWNHYYGLISYLNCIAMKEPPGKGMLSEREAEELVEKTMDQPAIRGMLKGESPKKRLSKKLLRSRLFQNIVRHIQSPEKECQFLEESNQQMEPSDPIYRDIFRKELRGAVKDALSKMDEYPTERKVLILRIYHQKSYTEIGQMCDRSDQWASNTYHRGVDRLKQLLNSWK